MSVCVRVCACVSERQTERHKESETERVRETERDTEVGCRLNCRIIEPNCFPRRRVIRNIRVVLRTTLIGKFIPAVRTQILIKLNSPILRISSLHDTSFSHPNLMHSPHHAAHPLFSLSLSSPPHPISSLPSFSKYSLASPPLLLSFPPFLSSLLIILFIQTIRLPLIHPLPTSLLTLALSQSVSASFIPSLPFSALPSS